MNGHTTNHIGYLPASPNIIVHRVFSRLDEVQHESMADQTHGRIAIASNGHARRVFRTARPSAREHAVAPPAHIGDLGAPPNSVVRRVFERLDEALRSAQRQTQGHVGDLATSPNKVVRGVFRRLEEWQRKHATQRMRIRMGIAGAAVAGIATAAIVMLFMVGGSDARIGQQPAADEGPVATSVDEPALDAGGEGAAATSDESLGGPLSSETSDTQAEYAPAPAAQQPTAPNVPAQAAAPAPAPAPAAVPADGLPIPSLPVQPPALPPLPALP